MKSKKYSKLQENFDNQASLDSLKKSGVIPAWTERFNKVLDLKNSTEEEVADLIVNGGGFGIYCPREWIRCTDNFGNELYEVPMEVWDMLDALEKRFKISISLTSRTSTFFEGVFRRCKIQGLFVKVSLPEIDEEVKGK